MIPARSNSPTPVSTTGRITVVAALIAATAAAMPWSTGYANGAVDDGQRIRIEVLRQDPDNDDEEMRERLRALEQRIAEIRAREQGGTTSNLVTVIPDDEDLRELPLDEQFAQTLANLDADDFAARQRATFDLIDARISQMQFYAALARGGLSAEQRHRLLKIIEERLLYQPRGALGIQMTETGNAGIVQVTNLVPGLPAERLLQINDVITEIDGVTPGSGEMVQHIQAHRPGDVITLTVERVARNGDGNGNAGDDDDGREVQTLTIDVELGSTELLDGGGNPNVGGVRRSSYDPRAIEFNEVMRRWGNLGKRAAVSLWPSVLLHAQSPGD